ncbi:competence damage-inducible [Fusarium albosuccineum]|uniref:Competence damage-inducible n=1 Tax=Fusarium albosuccineum TaxID=1237068 RepID=A0A8H4LA52_9HYPO|nr:competence damage-inducible [Fusarium albosuccineum]
MASTPQYIKRSSETLFEIAGDVIQLLKQAHETVSVAESLTGGGIMAALTSVPGASAVFRGGVVSYATGVKQNVLKVNGDLITEHGVIHGDVAQQMAEGARNITALDTATTWGISTTGVAGPDKQDGKPVGTVFIGISSADQTQALGPFHFPGDRDRIRQATVTEALAQLRELLITRIKYQE